MSEQNGDFGKRGSRVPAGRTLPGPEPTSILSSRLVKQIAGIALGAAIIVALYGINTMLMKRMGRQLSQSWSEHQTGISPQSGIDALDGRSAGSPIVTCATGTRVCE